MNLFFSKLLTLFIYPFGFSVTLLILAGFLFYCKKRRPALILFFSTIVFLWICSMPIVAAHLQAKLERLYLPTRCEESPSADAIVILGGAVGVVAYPRQYPDLYSSSDRVLHAARLYKAKKAPMIIASGGHLPWEIDSPEAAAMLQLLEEWGVPKKAVILEKGSMTTRDNAFDTLRIMRANKMKKILLVTSALHMRRSLAAFRSLGIDALPAPTDYEVVDGRQKTTLLDFLPDIGSLCGTTRVIHELAGYLYYKWLGWA